MRVARHDGGLWPVAGEEAPGAPLPGLHRDGAGLEAEGDLGISFLPRDLGPSNRGPPHRAPEPFGIVMELLEPIRLRTDEAARERTVSVAAYGDAGLAVDVER